MQAEIWRAASHSRFYARYFRVFPGFLGLKSFLNFFKKRVLGPIFTLQSSSEVTRIVVLPSPPHALHPKFFLKIFPAPPPGSQMTGQSGRQIARQSDNQTAKAVWQPTHPSNHLGKDHPYPAPPKTKSPGDSKIPETTKKPRGEPRGLSGAVDET